ncbi:MAG: NUDIX hydrolase [Planctomycetota bacterium]|nr:MAG: NUDIX hydrolase [Planctomycetota bacterium]
MAKDDYNKGTKKAFETPWFSIDAIPLESGAEPYYSISCPDSAVILAQTLDHKFILVRQFRQPQNGYTLELPSGYVREGESHEETIRRELQEETGYCCTQIIYLGALKICPSRINNTIHAYYGNKAELLKNKDDSHIEVVLVSRESFKEYILNGTYNESTGIAVYFISKAKSLFNFL